MKLATWGLKRNTPTDRRPISVEVKTLLVVSASRSPSDLATSTEPPMPKSIIRKLKKMTTGMVRLMAEMASGPMNWLTTMASVVMAICDATDAKMDAHINW